MYASTTTLENNVEASLKKTNIDLPYDPAIPLLRIYPNESNSGYSTGTHVYCSTIAKLWK
jgi:hypothetical protein